MAFERFYLTDAGTELLAKAQVGGSLTFTRVAAGDGTLDNQSITSLTDLINRITYLQISEAKCTGTKTVDVTIQFTNKDLQSPFYWREIGLYAKGSDGKEILYAYANSGDKADYIPSYGTSPTEFIFMMSSSIGNAQNVTAEISKSLVYVPVGRKLNGHDLSEDRDLSAADVHARPDTWMPTTNDVGAVPTSRTVNGKALSANITLTADDVSALGKYRNPHGSYPNYDNYGSSAIVLGELIAEQAQFIDMSQGFGNATNARNGMILGNDNTFDNFKDNTVYGNVTNYCIGGYNSISGRAQGTITLGYANMVQQQHPEQYIWCKLHQYNSSNHSCTLSILSSNLPRYSNNPEKFFTDLPNLNLMASMSCVYGNIRPYMSTVNRMNTEINNLTDRITFDATTNLITVALPLGSWMKFVDSWNYFNKDVYLLYFCKSSDYGYYGDGNCTIGSQNVSYGNNAITIGRHNCIYHEGTAIGRYLSDCCSSYDKINAMQRTTLLGQFNKEVYANTSAVAEECALIIGSGTTQSDVFNALVVKRNGDVYTGGSGSYHTGGADYSEYFEWQDENSNKEDRVGRFVTLDGEKIRYAKQGEDITGITSASPAIIGDDFSESWHGKYETDIFGRVQTEECTIPEEVIPADKEAGKAEKTIPAHTEIRMKLNPNFDSAKDAEYQTRDSRQEWSTVGMLGKLVLIDDGTCAVNGYCQPSASGDGTATKSDTLTNCRVMARLDSTHIKVLL